MKLTINSKEILKAVQTVGSLIKTPASSPILDNVLFDFRKDKLTLVADNLEVRSSVELDINNDDEHLVCVPYLLLTNILKTFPDTAVDIIFEEKEATLKMSSGEYKIPITKGAEFPKSNFESAEEKVKLNSLDLVEALKKALAFTGTDVLTFDSTILIWIEGDKTRIVGGTNKGLYEETLDATGKAVQLIISKSIAQYLTNSIDSEEAMELSYLDNKIYFTLEGRQISAVLSNIKYPNYEALFNGLLKTNNRTFKVDKDLLMPALKRLSSITEKTFNIIKFNFNDKNLELSFSHAMQMYNAKESLECDYTGEPIITGFPANQLINIMNFTEGETTMEFSEETKPCLITQGQIRCLIAAMKPTNN